MEGEHIWRVWFAFFVAAVIVVLGAFALGAYNTHQFVAGGYCETTLVGNQNFAWVRCPGK